MRRQHDLAKAVSLFLIGVGVLAMPALAEDCPELIGRSFGIGRVDAGAASDGYAYVVGSGLTVIDVSDPSAPVVVGFVDTPTYARDVAASGRYVYVLGYDGPTNRSGLWVIDVNAPSAPVVVGFVDKPSAREVAVSGHYAYVVGYDQTTDANGLWVIDVTAASAPVVVGFVDTPGEALDVAVSGLHAYVADGYDQGLRVIDVSTPSAPVDVGIMDRTSAGDARMVAVSGSYAYVTGGSFWGSGQLRVFDVSVPSAPVEAAVIDTPGIAEDIAAAGDYVYVAAGGDGLRVIDVRRPYEPFEIGLVYAPGNALDVAVSGSRAYVTAAGETGGGGLVVIDVSAPSAPVELGLVGWPAASAREVAVSGDYAYVVGRGFTVMDVSAPSEPVEVGGLWMLSANDIAVSGGYAYVASDWRLQVIDVSTPSAPVEVGVVDMPASARDVAVSGRYVYVAAGRYWNLGSGELHVIDVSVPSAPVEVGFVETPGAATGVAVADGFAYVAEWGGGVRVIDVSRPAAPVAVGFVERLDRALAVAVSGRYVYVAGWAGLGVIDVSVPSAPVEVGRFQVRPGQSEDVAISGGYAYLAAGSAGLLVFDVNVPSEPVEVGWSDIEGSAVGVAVSDGSVYLAASAAGLYTFSECPGPFRDARESFFPAAALAAGAQGGFFQSDVEINNTGMEEAQVTFQWLPRGEDNSEPMESGPITVGPGQSQRYENVLTELFGLGPDSLGALKMVASTESIIGMSRTYNIPAGETAGTFGQGLPAIRATQMIAGTDPQRILFLSDEFLSRANIGCVNGTDHDLTINIELFNSDGESLETKTMDLGPWSNNQINRIFGDHQLVRGYVDVWADSLGALYYCYGSALDNLTSDPTTILPQVPSSDIIFIPGAALVAGLEDSYFRTDLELNNVGRRSITYELLWLPRGADNGDPVRSDTFSLARGTGVRYANVLGSVFGLEPDHVGALAIEASGIDLLAMSRTYNLPSAKVAGTFGQELPGIPADRMITTGERKRIIFMNENDDIRSNVGCQNGSPETVRVFIELFNAEGEPLETRTMDLAPWSNNQITRVFRNYAPITAGYVDVWTYTPGAWIYCYGSVLDNLTSDPTTVLPQ